MSERWVGGCEWAVVGYVDVREQGLDTIIENRSRGRWEKRDSW